jgi:hypothetical protein
MKEYYPQTPEEKEVGLWRELPPAMCRKNKHIMRQVKTSLSKTDPERYYSGLYCKNCHQILKRK